MAGHLTSSGSPDVAPAWPGPPARLGRQDIVAGTPLAYAGPNATINFRDIADLDLLGAIAEPHRLLLGLPMRSHPPAPLFNAAALPERVIADHVSRRLVPGPEFCGVTGHELGGFGLLQQGGRVFVDDRVQPEGFNRLIEPHTMPAHWAGSICSPAAEIIETDTPVGVALNAHLVWGHFLLEMLARVHLLAQMRALGHPVPIAVPSDSPAWIRAFISLYFAEGETLAYDSQRQRVRAPCFVLPGMMMHHYHFHPALNPMVDELLARIVGPGRLPADRPRRIYLSRSRHACGSHAIANEPEVEAVLADLGFTILHPQELPLRTQLAIYAGADCIVSQFSSAAHNALFAPRGTPVFCFGWMNRCQSGIAALRGQPLAYLKPGGSDLIYPPAQREPGIFRLRVDCAELARALPAFLRFAEQWRAARADAPTPERTVATAAVPPLATGTSRVPLPFPGGDHMTSSGATTRRDPDILAHIQNVGDEWFAAGGWVGKAGSNRCIEGFAIGRRGDIGAIELRYRVIQGDGSLSDWSDRGRFCGTRGQNRPIHGFCIELLGGTADEFDCSYDGIFADGVSVGLVRQPAVCRSAGLAPLEAFRIRLYRRDGTLPDQSRGRCQVSGGNGRLVAITRILNEADIVEAFVRHTAALVDHHILLDNGSTDGTLDILEALRTEGLSLEVHHSAEVAFAESAQNNILFRLAAGARGADWVLPLDTDEFIDARGEAGGLRAALHADAPDAFKVRVREYIATPQDDAAEALVLSRITRARAPTDNMKVIARGSLLDRGADLQPGGHGIQVRGEEVPWLVLERVVYAHYAVRSPWQWITKFVIGWSKVLAAGSGTVARGYSDHYREPFRILKAAPAQILRNASCMAFRDDVTGLTSDPLPYLGAPLRFTPPVDHAMRAVAALMTHLESLSLRHGELAETEAGRAFLAVRNGGTAG